MPEEVGDRKLRPTASSENRRLNGRDIVHGATEINASGIEGTEENIGRRNHASK
jgi:hypothetical protein